MGSISRYSKELLIFRRYVVKKHYTHIPLLCQYIWRIVCIGNIVLVREIHMEDKYKRINILIRPEQHKNVMDRGLSLSGLVRDLLDDRFSDTKILLNVGKDTKKLYDHVISNFGADDLELEKYLVEALDNMLVDKKKEIETLRVKLRAKK